MLQDLSQQPANVIGLENGFGITRISPETFAQTETEMLAPYQDAKAVGTWNGGPTWSPQTQQWSEN